jgi:D-alanine-D-alanine ligase
MNTNVGILFGGISPEHEVSVITGLQVLEQIDREVFDVFAIYQDQRGVFWWYPGLRKRTEFKNIKPTRVYFGKDEKGGFFKSDNFTSKKVHLDAAYLAYHGGDGEMGVVAGMLQTVSIPFTSTSVEASAIVMNKVLTKEVLEMNGIETVPWTRLFSYEVLRDVNICAAQVIKQLTLPVIIKPAHLGSSIGIHIAKTPVELKKFLLEAAHVDKEILIEQFIDSFTEYNSAVRLVNGKCEVSEIEEPIARDEILSFADKYQRGGGKKGVSGMASLVRHLPADIPVSLKSSIQEAAKKVFEITRSKGMVRVDFMKAKNKLYVVEVNPIPGSMAYYLWEATGISFPQQITDMIQQAIHDAHTEESLHLVYNSDIVEKFIASNKGQ